MKLHLLGDSKQMQGIQAGDRSRQVQELGVRQEVDTEGRVIKLHPGLFLLRLQKGRTARSSFGK